MSHVWNILTTGPLFALGFARDVAKTLFTKHPMFNGQVRVDGKTIAITGANIGIGKETARDLIRRGGRVIILCRDSVKGNNTVEELTSEFPGSTVIFYQLDLANLESVRACAAHLKKKEPKIHILINNAGISSAPKGETKDGFETQFGTNHLGHFLFTLLLLDNIKAAAPSRIVTVSSIAHQDGEIYWDDLNMNVGYEPYRAYSQSKLANILFTKSLAEKLKGTGVSSYSLHPGTVATDIWRHAESSYGVLGGLFVKVWQKFMKTIIEGAQTTIYCAVEESIADESGYYYSDCMKITPSRQAQNMEDAERLWNVSLEILGLKDFKL